MKFASFLAAHARNTPDKDAVICGAEKLTFGELDESTDRLANALRDKGVKVGDRVAIQLHNTVEFVRAFMAATKAGAISVPVNTRLAPGEIAYILSDCAPSAVFFSDETREVLDKAAADAKGLVRIIAGTPRAGEFTIAGLIAAGAPGTPAVPPEFDDSMIVYTSGTTGKPKGAILTQANSIIPNGYLNMVQYGVSAADRQLVTTPLAHRTGFARMANMLLHGSTLVVIETEGAGAAEAPVAPSQDAIADTPLDLAAEVADQLGADDDSVEAENPGVAQSEGKQPAFETGSAPAQAGAVADAAPTSPTPRGTA